MYADIYSKCALHLSKIVYLLQTRTHTTDTLSLSLTRTHTELRMRVIHDNKLRTRTIHNINDHHKSNSSPMLYTS